MTKLASRVIYPHHPRDWGLPMASVFLSYDRDDAAKARSIAVALEKAGHSVWWDRHIKGGAQYSKEIEVALEAAEAVIVLWSERSVESAWVRDEAAAGRDTGRLVPVLIDGTEPPLGFRQYQSIDLSKWKGRGKAFLIDALLEAIAGVASTPGSEPSIVTTRKRGSIVFLRAILIGVAALALATAAFFGWRFFAGRSAVALVAVTAANPTGSGQELADDLLVKLAELQSGAVDSIRLANAADVGRADLLFKVDGSLPGQPQASLILQSRDGTILWSGSFQQPSGNVADLKQQLAFSAARILGCATDGMSAEGERLDQQTLKIYLNACAQSAEIMRSDPTSIVRVLSRIVEDKPGFEPAWAELLMAESEITGLAFNEGQPPRQLLAAHRRHIEQAKRAFPGMPEVLLAEAALVPPRNFVRRTKLIDEAATRDPDNANVQSFVAGAMLSAGRLREAIDAARRASELDPLSPARVNGYISTLAYAGATDAAKRELTEAEKLWPGAASIRDAQWRFHARYGDPRIAKAIFDQDSDSDGRGWPIYLATRINPSPSNVERLVTYVGERLDSMSNPTAGIGFATLAYGQFGRKEEIFRTLLDWDKPDDIATITDVLFRPEFQQVRRDLRFMHIARRAGLIDYWRSSGKWPDFCFDTDQTYDCKAEAAKLGA